MDHVYTCRDSGINAVENEIFPAFASFGNACKVIKDEVRIASQTEHRHAMKRAELIKFLERGKNNMEEQQYVLNFNHVTQA